MDIYEKLTIQIREAAEGKAITEKIDYTTDYFAKDWLNDKYKDWEKILFDLEKHLNSTIYEIISKLDFDVPLDFTEDSIEKLDLVLEKYDEKFMDSDEAEFDPFEEVNFNEAKGHGKIKTLPTDEKYEINSVDDLKKYRRNYRFIVNYYWLKKQSIRIKICLDFFELNSDLEPFKRVSFENSIPFLGHQDVLISFLYLLMQGQFFPVKTINHEEILKSFGLNQTQVNQFKIQKTITQKELSRLFSQSFHCFEIIDVDEINNVIVKTNPISFSVVEKSLKSTLNSIDGKYIIELKRRFQLIMDELDVIEKLNESKSKMEN